MPTTSVVLLAFPMAGILTNNKKAAQAHANEIFFQDSVQSSFSFSVTLASFLSARALIGNSCCPSLLLSTISHSQCWHQGSVVRDPAIPRSCAANNRSQNFNLFCFNSAIAIMITELLVFNSAIFLVRDQSSSRNIKSKRASLTMINFELLIFLKGYLGFEPAQGAGVA